MVSPKSLLAGVSAALVMTTQVALASAPAMPDPFANCHAQFAKNPDNYDSAYCFFETASRERLTAEAARVFEELIQRYPQNLWLPLAYGHLFRSTDPSRAESLYRRAADGFRAAGNADGEILARSNLRNFLFPRGRVDDAAKEMARVVEIGGASTDPLLKARAWTLQAQHVQDSGGDLGLAYLLLKQTEAAIFPNGPYRLQRTTLNSLGLVAFRLGRFDEALAVFEKLDAVASAAGEGLAQANARFNIFNTSTLRETLLPTPGARQRLMALAERALTAGEAAQNREVTLKSHLAMAELLAASGARQDALAHADTCVQLATNYPHDEAACSWIRASLLKDDARDQAEDAARRALEATARANNPRTQSFSAGAQMRFSWDFNPRERALQDSLAAIDTIERLRSLQNDAQSSAGLFSTWTSDYYWLSGRLLQEPQPDLELAFSITERMRARALLDAVDRSPLPAGVTTVAANRSFASLSAVQSKLGDNEALLSFQVGLWETYDGLFGGGSWVIALTRETRSVYRLPDRTRLVPLMPVFNGLIKRTDALETASAVRLYRELLSDALGRLPAGVERLIVVPDGALHQLPFDALRSSPQDPALAAKYELTIVPSATLWLRWREKGWRQPTGKALTLADPELRVSTDKPAMTRDAPTLEGIQLGRLPHARRESRSLADHFDTVDTLVGAQASERAVKERALKDYDVVHFAAHAIADNVHPERSAVLLSAGAESEDGLLQAREIEALNLDGGIVVLSACQTAAGAELSGEGVLSLARSFFQAGARSVIGSRWPIRDDDAATIFESFYRHLSEGASLSEALKRAKVDAIADDRPAAAWAGLVLLGDGDFRPFPHGRAEPRPAFPLIWAVGVLALVCAASVWRLVFAHRIAENRA